MNGGLGQKQVRVHLKVAAFETLLLRFVAASDYHAPHFHEG